eukprot:Hpha_TRINITY_DN16237_c1_g1::TRINITY_DN16237_c1_g1_i1::g.16474::m.16474
MGRDKKYNTTNVESVENPDSADEESGPKVKTPQSGNEAKKESYLSEENENILRHVFEQGDTDKSGTITPAELIEIWGIAFPRVGDGAQVQGFVDHVFTDIDVDDSGEITFEEFIAYLRGDRVGDCDGIQLVDGQIYQKHMPESCREWVWAMVEQPASEIYSSTAVRIPSLIISFFLQFLILVSICNMVVESLPDYQKREGGAGTEVTFAVETTCIAFFTLEFLTRWVSCVSQREYWTDLFTWIDLCAIIPYYLVVGGILKEGGGTRGLVALRVIRLVRMVRVLRVLKLGRRSQGIQLMLIALKRSSMGLTWLCILVLMATTLFAALMYYTERDESDFDFDGVLCTGCKGKWVRQVNSSHEDAGQRLPQAFQSIPDSMWWAVVTISTVGYGDASPVTGMGKCVAVMTMLSAVLVLAYPVTILNSAFSEAWEEFRNLKYRETRKQRVQVLLKELSKRPPLSIGLITEMKQLAPSQSASAKPDDVGSNGSMTDIPNVPLSVTRPTSSNAIVSPPTTPFTPTQSEVGPRWGVQRKAQGAGDSRDVLRALGEIKAMMMRQQEELYEIKRDVQRLHKGRGNQQLSMRGGMVKLERDVSESMS